ncbi:Protein phosphatase 2C [Micromonospora pattaloongensis]|uniref:Protein phosphatase 2C n=1 Tax=Micromonospora pattaloongensis TaxID=405436 RepID=A0A1H3T0R8_9ACTN|nr:protein phosphatase 2C domain-containing protein [Micromonospora pattaloongensis]SDZ43478.1 Protein phosphatase 2C [Micromonospora pattaloongensis]
MRVSVASEAGSPTTPNEDWGVATEGLIVVLDGATARTGTGCSHGVAWYAGKLGSALTGFATDRDTSLGNALTLAIRSTADQHRDCDLEHPGTPSAATAILRLNGDKVEYLVLGDVSIVIDAVDGVDQTAKAERAEADRHPFGSAEKQAALLRMKHAELAARNTPDYWVAAANPTVAIHAITGSLPLGEVRRVAVLTDGAARIVNLFELLNWPGVLDVLDQHGPTELIRRVRAVESAGPTCMRWARNKSSDDATAVYAC